jgi:hypothetical protein
MPSWLKKVGQVGIILGKQAPIFGPVLKVFLPDVGDKIVDKVTAQADALAQIGNVIVNIEVISNLLTQPLPGDEKLKAVSVPTAQILLEYFKSRGLELDKDKEAEFKQSAQQVAQGIVGCLNACKE